MPPLLEARRIGLLLRSRTIRSKRLTCTAERMLVRPVMIEIAPALTRRFGAPERSPRWSTGFEE